MQLGAENRKATVRRVVVPDGGAEGREGTGKTKLRKATNKRKSKAQEV